MKVEKFPLIGDVNLNLVTFILILQTILGVYWLSSLQLASGTMYLTLFTSAIAVYVILLLVVKESDRQYNLRLPFAKNNITAIILLLLGLLVPFVLFGLSLFLDGTTFNVFTLSFSPLVSFSDKGNLVPFSILQAQNDPFFTNFIIINVAPVLEELVTGFFLIIFGLALGFLIRWMFKLDFGKNNNNFDFWAVALPFSIIVFTILHKFNGTYISTSQFMIAAFVRTLLNIVIWKLYMGLEFAIGAHTAFNSIALGFKQFVSGYFTLGGFIIIFFYIAIIFALIIRLKESKESLKQIFKNLVGG